MEEKTETKTDEKIKAIELEVSKTLAKVQEGFKTDAKEMTDGYKAEMQTMMTALAAQMEEQKGASAELLDKLAKGTVTGVEAPGAEDGKCFQECLKGMLKGDKSILEKYGVEGVTSGDSPSIISSKVLVEGTTTLGGYIVPTTYYNQVLDLVASYNVIMQITPKYLIPNWKLDYPSITSGSTGYWVDEASEKTVSDLTFGKTQFELHKACVLQLVANELLEDSTPAVEGLLKTQFAKCIDNLVDLEYLQGTGSPITGLLTSITTNTVAAGRDLTFDHIFEAISLCFQNHAKKIAIIYNPRTEGRLRQIKGVNGQYIWQNASAGSPATIMGYPCYKDANVPVNLGDSTDESYIIVGDFDYAGVGVKSGKGGLVINAGLNASDFQYDKTSFRAVFRTDFQVFDETKFAEITEVI